MGGCGLRCAPSCKNAPPSRKALEVDELGPAVVYFGPRYKESECIYLREVEQWEAQGIVKVKTACSNMDDQAHRYVHDLILEEKEEMAQAFRDGGRIFLSGCAARLGKSTEDACKQIGCERTGKGQEEAEEWLQSVKTDRYVIDVY